MLKVGISLHWYLAIVYNPGALVADVGKVDDSQHNDEHNSSKTDSGDSIHLEEEDVVTKPGQSISHLSSDTTSTEVESAEKSDQSVPEEPVETVNMKEEETGDQQESKSSALHVDSDPSDISEEEGVEPSTQENVVPMELDASASPELSSTSSHSKVEEDENEDIVDMKVSEGNEAASEEFVESPKLSAQASNESIVEVIEEGSVQPPIVEATDETVEVQISSSSSGNNEEVFVRRTPRRKPASSRDGSPEIIVSPESRPSKKRKSTPMDIDKQLEKEAEREMKFQEYLKQ